MAVMIPPEPPRAGPGARAEGLLFEALRTGLPEGFFVYGRLPYVERSRAREGEADFVVVHREQGILVLECKGHGVRRKGTGEWVRLVGGAEERLDESPFLQAQRHAKELEAELAARSRPFLPAGAGAPFVFGHAVAFPTALAAAACPLPLEAPREILLDAADLGVAGDRVQAALAFWRKAAGRKVVPLSQADFKRWRRRALHPVLEVVESLGASIRSESQVMLRLTEEQSLAVEGWLGNPRLRVQGGAGTGKTVLALEALRRMAEDEGRAGLLLCFNRRLGAHLASAAASWGLGEEQAHATTFHRLCGRASHLLSGHGLVVPEDPDAAVRYWVDEAPCVLLDAIAAGMVAKPEAIVVDEAQDFAPSWWDVLEELLAPGGRIIAFYDPAQAVFGRPCSVPTGWPVIRLTRNLRNTRRIAEAVMALGSVEMRSHEGAPDGEPPDVRQQESPSRTQKALDALVQRLLGSGLVAEQIAILTPHSRPSSSLRGLAEVAGLELADEPGGRPGALLHTTITAFKGLEADVVVLLDVDPADPRCDRAVRYVGASRARHRLYVFARGDWME
jgi:hypothetical protein